MPNLITCFYFSLGDKLFISKADLTKSQYCLVAYFRQCAHKSGMKMLGMRKKKRCEVNFDLKQREQKETIFELEVANLIHCGPFRCIAN